MYQDYMKQVPIPTHRGSVIPFTSWTGLSKSIKQLYGQPLHYLTNILLNQWDKMRIGCEDEDVPLDTLIHPCKAEATVWLVEEIHRLSTSHHHLAKLWLSDPRPHAYIDPIFPKLWRSSGEIALSGCSTSLCVPFAFLFFLSWIIVTFCGFNKSTANGTEILGFDEPLGILIVELVEICFCYTVLYRVWSSGNWQWKHIPI